MSAGAGLTLTSGNTDTSTINASYDITYAPGTSHVVKFDGLLVRGTTEDAVSADRLGLNIRDEMRLSDRTYVFAQNQYLRDRFKSIDYLLSPSGGVGYTAIEVPETSLAVDVGIGGVWERNFGEMVQGSGAVTLRQKLVHTLTGTTSLTQSYSGLWKTTDFKDSLHAVNLGVAVAMSARTQLKIELLDTYNNKPSLASVKKNDVMILVAVVYSM